MNNKEKMQFKDVAVEFNFKNVPACDQEYLRTMFYQTVGDRSVNHTGIPFSEFYPDATSFTLFDSRSEMINFMSEYAWPSANTASHLLNGKKYFLAWTFNYDKASAVVTI